MELTFAIEPGTIAAAMSVLMSTMYRHSEWCSAIRVPEHYVGQFKVEVDIIVGENQETRTLVVTQDHFKKALGNMASVYPNTCMNIINGIIDYKTAYAWIFVACDIANNNK